MIIRRNLCMASGLVNGAVGTLTDIVFINGEVEALKVLFDHEKKERIIDRVVAKFDITEDQKASRSQFPLVVGFAITIHKCQGISVDNIMTEMGEMFAESMA